MTQDTLSDVLRSVRLRGALFFHIDCTNPWVTEAPKASVIAPEIMPDSEHVMEYHVLIQGTCWAGVIGEPPVELHKGDVIAFPHGDAHVLSSEPGMRTKTDFDFLAQRPPQLPFMLHQGHAADSAESLAEAQVVQTSVLCGFLGW